MRNLFALWLIGCTGTSEAEPEPTVSERVSAPGPHTVGHQRTEFTYAALGTGADRTIPVEIWYPAIDGGEGAAVYGIAGVVQLPDDQVRSGAEPEDGSFPVALYSHGSGGVGALAYPYARLLASHGWVVVAPDHVGNTALDALNGIDFVQVAIDRPVDVTATLDALESGPLATVVGGAADVDRTVLFGHSFGGYTVFAAPGLPIDAVALGCSAGSTDPECEPLQNPAVSDRFLSPTLDARIQAIVPQAPALVQVFDSQALAELPVPMLLMSGQRDQTIGDANNAKVAWDVRTNAADRWIRLPDGGHYSFITVCDDIPAGVIAAFVSGADSDGCGDDFTPVADIVPVLASYTLGFAELYGRGDTDFAPLFDTEPTLSTEMVLRQR